MVLMFSIGTIVSLKKYGLKHSGSIDVWFCKDLAAAGHKAHGFLNNSMSCERPHSIQSVLDVMRNINLLINTHVLYHPWIIIGIESSSL